MGLLGGLDSQRVLSTYIVKSKVAIVGIRK